MYMCNALTVVIKFRANFSIFLKIYKTLKILSDANSMVKVYVLRVFNWKLENKRKW